MFLKERYKLDEDRQVAELIGLHPKTLATAKGRNSIPFEELIIFCNKNGIPFEVFFGDENKDSAGINGDEYALLAAYRKFPPGSPERRAMQALAGLPMDSLKK